MVSGSWLMAKAHDSCRKARDSRLMAKKNLALGPSSGGFRAKFSLALSHEPRATSLKAWATWATNHELLTINNRLIHALSDNILYVFCIRHHPRNEFKVSKFQSFKSPGVQSSKRSEMFKVSSFQNSNAWKCQACKLLKMEARKLQSFRFPEVQFRKVANFRTRISQRYQISRVSYS